MATVLLVEDNESVRGTLRRVLERLGHVVLVAGDGTAALDLCRTVRPDVVLTDVLMPGADGLELINWLKRSTHPVPVIAMSGGGVGDAEDYLGAAQKLGAVRVLTKPIDANVLKNTVEEVLAGARQPG